MTGKNLQTVTDANWKAWAEQYEVSSYTITVTDAKREPYLCQWRSVHFWRNVNVDWLVCNSKEHSDYYSEWDRSSLVTVLNVIK